MANSLHQKDQAEEEAGSRDAPSSQLSVSAVDTNSANNNRNSPPGSEEEAKAPVRSNQACKLELLDVERRKRLLAEITDTNNDTGDDDVSCSDNDSTTEPPESNRILRSNTTTVEDLVTRPTAAATVLSTTRSEPIVSLPHQLLLNPHTPGAVSVYPTGHDPSVTADDAQVVMDEQQEQEQEQQQQQEVEGGVSGFNDNNNDNDEENPVTLGRVTAIVSAELVDSSRERELEERVRQLQEQVQHAISQPVIQAQPIEDDDDDDNNNNCNENYGDDPEDPFQSNNKFPGGSLRFNRKLSKGTTQLIFLALAVLVAVVIVVTTVLLTTQNEKRSDESSNGTSTENEPTTTTVSTPKQKSALDIIYSEPRFSTFRNYLFSTGVTSENRIGRNVTFLVPTNEAFARYLPVHLHYHEPRGVAHLRAIIDKHIYLAIMDDQDMKNGDEYLMSNDEVVTAGIEYDDEKDDKETHEGERKLWWTPALDASRVNVTEPTILAEHGDMIYVLDGLIMPDFYEIDLFDLALQLNLTEAAEWMRRGDLEGVARTSEDFTLFLPSNDAMARMAPEHRLAAESNADFLFQILLSHVSRLYFPTKLLRDKNVHRIEGFTKGTFLYVEHGDDDDKDDKTIHIGIDNGMKGKIILADQVARNGILHVIDTALVPG